MTWKVFWEDPYATGLVARVTGAVGDDITVDRTIFYAFSGGQESDHGTIGGKPVLRARKQDREIFYTLEPGHGLKPGDRVRMTIDWERRYRLMRLHFAAELVLELVYAALPSIEKIGAHIAENKARIDFRWDQNISTLFPTIKEKALRIVAADEAITSAYSDRETERRYWQIDAFAQVPCGGTHLRRTGEVGGIALKRKNIGRGKERIEVTLGDSPL